MFGRLRKRIKKLEEKTEIINCIGKIAYYEIDHTVVCNRCGGIFLEHFCKFKAILEYEKAVREAYCVNCWEKIQDVQTEDR